MTTTKYNQLVIDHFDHPRNAAAAAVGAQGALSGGFIAGEGGSVDGGAWIEFQLKVEQKQIQSACFRAYGCPHTVALASWLTQRLVGETLFGGYTLDKQEIGAELGWPTEKMRGLLVAEDAIRACAAKLEQKEDE